MKDTFTLLNVEPRTFKGKDGKDVTYYPIALLTKGGEVLKGSTTLAGYEKMKTYTAQNILGVATIELRAGFVKGERGNQEIVKMVVTDFAPGK